MKNREIDNYTKLIDVKGADGTVRKHKLFDFDKIWEAPEPIFILFSERGAYGKTLGSKKLSRDIKLNEGLNSIFVMNTERQIKKDKVSYLTKPKQIFYDEFENTDIDNTGVYDFDEVEKENKKTGEVTISRINKEYYTYFHNLNGAEKAKGSRKDIGLMIYDEINVGVKDLRGDQTELVLNLISTYKDAVHFDTDPFKKVILLANLKSLNSKLLMDWGISKIDKEVNRFEKDGLTIIVLCPKKSKEEKEEFESSHKGDWSYQLAKVSNQDAHIYNNETLYDDINCVNQYTEDELNRFFNLKYIFKTKYGFIFTYYSEKFNWHIVYRRLYTGTQPIYTLIKKDIKEHSTLVNNQFKKNFLSMIQKGLVSFQDIYSREQLIDLLVKN